jgi:hypothetical protein
MKIELKNIKHAVFASEETLCFEATVYIDGKRTGTVQNDGKGGANRYHPYELQEKLAAHAATLPDVVFHGRSIALDADIFVDELLSILMSKKALMRLMAKNIVFRRDGKIFKVSALDRLSDAGLSKQLGADAILNLLPIDAAVGVYRGKQ